MKAMSFEEMNKWCSQGATGLALSHEGELRYKLPSEHKFFVEVPEEHRKIVVLARAMLLFRGESHFNGGMLWLRRWDIGSPQLVQVGWRILEDIRRAHGESRSLEVAPAQLFRSDELVELHACLTQVMCFGWKADLVPFAGFFIHFKDNRQACFSAESPETLKELCMTFHEWNPTDEDPMIVKLAAMEKTRNAKKK